MTSAFQPNTKKASILKIQKLAEGLQEGRHLGEEPALCLNNTHKHIHQYLIYKHKYTLTGLKTCMCVCVRAYYQQFVILHLEAIHIILKKQRKQGEWK